MKMKTPNIGIRLALGFSIVLILLAFTAWLSISNLKQLNEGTDDIVSNSYPKVALSYKMLGNVDANARSMRNMLLLEDAQEVEKELKQILGRRANQENNIAEFEKLIDSQEERVGFQAVKDARAKYGASQRAIFKISSRRQAGRSHNLAVK